MSKWDDNSEVSAPLSFIELTLLLECEPGFSIPQRTASGTRLQGLDNLYTRPTVAALVRFVKSGV